MGLGRTLCAFLRLAPCAVACVWGGPPGAALSGSHVLKVNTFNVYSLPADEGVDRLHWTLVGAPSLIPEKQEGVCCRSLPFSTRNDSLAHVGIEIEASRGFSVEIGIYTNVGDFVDRLAFSVPQSQFQRLAPGSADNTRSLRVLWDNRTRSGRLAGTGAYILKSRVTLNSIPGASQGSLTKTDYRVVGLLRTL